MHKRDEVAGKRRRLLNEDLYDLCSSTNTIRVIKLRRVRWAGHVACIGDNRGVYSALVGKPDGNKPLGRSTRRWGDNIKIYCQEVGW